MYTTIAYNNSCKNEMVYNRKFENIEDAFEAAEEVGIAACSTIIDHNGLEMTFEDIRDRILGHKHHIVEVYFKGFSKNFDKCHIWFRCYSDKLMFESVQIIGKDGKTYNGYVTDEKYVDIYPAHMGKAII